MITFNSLLPNGWQFAEAYFEVDEVEGQAVFHNIYTAETIKVVGYNFDHAVLNFFEKLDLPESTLKEYSSSYGGGVCLQAVLPKGWVFKSAQSEYNDYAECYNFRATLNKSNKAIKMYQEQVTAYGATIEDAIYKAMLQIELKKQNDL